MFFNWTFPFLNKCFHTFLSAKLVLSMIQDCLKVSARLHLGVTLVTEEIELIGPNTVGHYRLFQFLDFDFLFFHL